MTMEKKNTDLSLINSSSNIMESLSKELSMLPVHVRDEIVSKIIEGEAELKRDYLEKTMKSYLAQNDLASFLDKIERLNTERKIYTANTSGETGSGSYSINVKGGDQNFVTQILIGIAIIVVLVIFIISR